MCLPRLSSCARHPRLSPALITDRLPPVLQIVQPASIVMSRDHRHFHNGIPQLPRDAQQLRIETPSLNRLQSKDRVSCRTPERFKAALGVLERKRHDEAGRPIETTSKESPIERLMNSLPRTVHPLGAHRNSVTGVVRPQKTLGLFHRRGKIRVRKYNNVTLCLQQAIANGEPFPPVHAVLNEGETTILFHSSLHDHSGVIGAAIIDDQSFRVPAHALQCTASFDAASFQCMGLRYEQDNAQRRIGHLRSLAPVRLKSRSCNED